MPFNHYIKPGEICRVNPHMNTYTALDNVQGFIRRNKQEIETDISKLKLSLRMGNFNDMDAVFALRNSHYTTPNSYTTHWFYHLTNYGSCILLEDANKQIVGYQFETSYLDAEKTSFVAGIVIDKQLRGYTLGEKLVRYSLVTAMEKGAKTGGGIIATDNFASITVFINKLGGTFVKFIPDFTGYGPRLVYKMPLTPAHLTLHAIDSDKLIAYTKKYQEGTDFKLISCNDPKTLENTLNHNDFKIVALVKKDVFDKNEVFFALPDQKLKTGQHA